MLTIRAISTAVAMYVAILFPALALADPCEGSHYEYDHGECYDKTGSTTGDILEMYRQSDRLQEGMANRERSYTTSSGRGAARLPDGARGKLIALGQAAVRTLEFTPTPTSTAVEEFARVVSQRERPGRRRLLQAMLHEYRKGIAASGLSPNVASTGYFFSLVAAYLVYNGERWTTTDLARGTWMGITLHIASDPTIANYSNAEMQHFSDHYALVGAGLVYMASEARAKHDAAGLREARAAALTFLRTIHRVDPRETPLDDTYCIANAAFLTTSCDMTKFILTQGHAGHNPFALP